MVHFHKVRITNKDERGIPFSTLVEVDGKPMSLIQEVGFHQSLEDFTTITLKLVGSVDFISDGCALILITEDGRKFRVIEEL